MVFSSVLKYEFEPLESTDTKFTSPHTDVSLVMDGSGYFDENCSPRVKEEHYLPQFRRHLAHLLHMGEKQVPCLPVSKGTLGKGGKDALFSSYQDSEEKI